MRSSPSLSCARVVPMLMRAKPSRLFDEEFRQRFVVEAVAAEVYPEYVRALGMVHVRLRHALLYELLREVAVRLEVGHELAVPFSALAVGGFHSRYAKDVQRVEVEALKHGDVDAAQPLVGDYRDGGFEPRDVEGFARRYEGEDVLVHSGQRAEAGVLRVAVDEVLVDFVGDDYHVLAAHDVGERLELLAAPYARDGVVRAAQDERAAGRRDEALELLEVHLVAAVSVDERIFDDYASGLAHRPVEGHVDRRLDDYLVARLRQPHRREGEPRDDAAGPAYRLAAELPAVVVALPRAHRVAQRIGDERIAERALVELRAYRVENFGRGGEVHVGDPHCEKVVRAEVLGHSVPLLALRPAAFHIFVKIVLHPKALRFMAAAVIYSFYIFYFRDFPRKYKIVVER